MGRWLVADLSVMDVHFQLWMVLVTGILLVWFLFVWATRPRSLRADLTLKLSVSSGPSSARASTRSSLATLIELLVF